VSDNRLLVPVAESSTLRQTVEYAVETVLNGPGDAYVRFIYVHTPDRTLAESADPDAEAYPEAEQAAELLQRISVWATEDAGSESDRLVIETDQVGQDRYLFGPEDLAAQFATEVEGHSIDRLVLDPEYDPGIGAPLLHPLEYELSRYEALQVEQAPVTSRTRRSPLVVRSTPVRVGSLFFVSFLFYQLLAGQLYWFDLVTGAMSATIVAVGLSRVTFHKDPTASSVGRVVRLVIYAPYLLYEILKANVLVAGVILHPRLPIEPRLTRVRSAVWGAIPVTTLANSITLTPGTLTVRVEGRTLTVHTLVVPAREDLFDGGLERAVRFVFYGREAMGLSSPRERGDTEILQPSDQSDGGAGTAVPDGGEPTEETGGDQS
jgi:multicomponent Na+:H+ antiporter subunit E